MEVVVIPPDLSPRPFQFAAILLGAFALACSPLRADSLLDVTFSSVPPPDEKEDAAFPGGNPIEFFDAYSWRMFLALNWPAKAGERGVPDENKDLTDISSPRVWESWRSTADLYSGDGTIPPPAWNAPPAADGPLAKTLSFAMVGPVLEDFNQVNSAGLAVGSLVARNRTYVRYEITMNEKEYTTIRDQKLYLRKTFKELSDQGKPVKFDDQSIEIKAAWWELSGDETPAQRARFYIVKHQVLSPETNTLQTKDFALIGFHIGQKTSSRRQWIWSTFEHVDTLNVDPSSPPGSQTTLVEAPDDMHATPPDGGVTKDHPQKPNPDPTQVRRFITNPVITQVSRPSTDATNAKWQNDPRLKDTVWKNYRLVLTQWPTVQNEDSGLGKPFPSSNVGNVTMETFSSLQRSSCIQCHLQSTSQTDFAWFVSLRALPVPTADQVIGGNSPASARARQMELRLKKAAAAALEQDPEPVFPK